MIRRALKSDVECDLHPELARACDQTREIVVRSELRMDRLVTAFGRADRPWTPDIGLFGL